LSQDLFGLRFPNPVGLAAGLDKNCEVFLALEALGFGAVVGGTVTLDPQSPLDDAFIAEYPALRSLINRLGFPNTGSHAIADELSQSPGTTIPRGLNIGLSRKLRVMGPADDYKLTLRAIYSHADFVEVNVSSPNTKNIRELQETGYFLAVLGAVIEEAERQSRPNQRKPILVKISPDIAEPTLAGLLKACLELGVDGLVVANTSLKRIGFPADTPVVGGVSGKPLFMGTRRLVRIIYQQTAGRLPIIAVGGISSAEDAFAMFENGASLVQVYTGFVTRDPFIARHINRGLLKLMRRRGIAHISDIPKPSLDAPPSSE
jgi:dihydroorotate dehydrogenase